MGTDGYQIYHTDHFIIYAKVKSLCITCETNITLYIKYISIKKRKGTDPLKKESFFKSHRINQTITGHWPPLKNVEIRLCMVHLRISKYATITVAE